MLLGFGESSKKLGPFLDQQFPSMMTAKKPKSLVLDKGVEGDLKEETLGEREGPHTKQKSSRLKGFVVIIEELFKPNIYDLFLEAAIDAAGIWTF